MKPPNLLKPSLNEIDWQDPNAHVTPNFTVREACWLPSVGALYYPSIEEQAQLYKLCHVMEAIRKLLGFPVLVHCMIRPEFYNSLPKIGGTKESKHLLGMACDFHVRQMSCDLVREVLRKNAEMLGICIEDRPGSSWVHIDIAEPRPNGGRFFKP